MKKTLFLLATLAIFAGCEKDKASSTNESTAESFLKVEVVNLSFDAIGGTQAIAVTSNVAWSIDEQAGMDWLTVTSKENSGNEIILLTAPANPRATTRTAKLTIKGENVAPVEISVEQKAANSEAAAAFLSVDNDTITVLGEGDEEYASMLTISANVAWRITKSQGADWLYLSHTSGKGNSAIYLIGNPNPSDDNERRMQLTITGEGLTPVVVVIVQQPARPVQALVLYSDTNEENMVPAAGGVGDFELTLHSESYTWSISTTASWVTLDRTNGNASTNFNITAAPNTGPQQREATISIQIAEKNRVEEFTIIQEGIQQ